MNETEPCCGDYSNCQKPCLPLANYWRNRYMDLLEKLPEPDIEYPDDD